MIGCVSVAFDKLFVDCGGWVAPESLVRRGRGGRHWWFKEKSRGVHLAEEAAWRWRSWLRSCGVEANKVLTSDDPVASISAGITACQVVHGAAA